MLQIYQREQRTQLSELPRRRWCCGFDAEPARLQLELQSIVRLLLKNHYIRRSLAYQYELVVSSRICTNSSVCFWAVLVMHRWDFQPTGETRACLMFTSMHSLAPFLQAFVSFSSRFMSLDPNEVGYFISQVGLAAASFGVASSDITIVANALVSYFDYRCTPPMTIVPGAGPQLQEICGDPTCPLAPTPKCYYYPSSGIEPAPQTAASCQSSPSSSTSASTMYTTTKKEYYTTPTPSSTTKEYEYSSTTTKYE